MIPLLRHLCNFMAAIEKERTSSFFTMCFGLCLPSKYTAVSTRAPRAELREPSEHKLVSKQPVTNWRDIPLLANYELIKQIGKGGFSEIWSATCTISRKTVAIKVVQLANQDLEPEEVSTLLSESKYLRSLDCPYLLHCTHVAATEEWMVMVLEYMAGGEMLDHIHKVKSYTEAEAAKLFAQIVSAVSYLHNLNIMHRDIKPENVMFVSPVECCEVEGRQLRVKLIDLGMAAMYDEKKPVHGCAGTPGFVAPELWNDRPCTPAADIYSLGVMLFVMLTGRKPHSGHDIRTMEYCNKPFREAVGLQDDRYLSLSPCARELLLSMLADDPLNRPSALAVLRHPFITAVDSNRQAHREMGEQVRKRMRDLNRIRRQHGLRYALAMSRPPGADQSTFLRMVDSRRLDLKKRLDAFGRLSSEAPTTTTDHTALSYTFPRSSLAISYDTAPDVISLPVRNTAIGCSLADVTTLTATARVTPLPGVGPRQQPPHHPPPPPPPGNPPTQPSTQPTARTKPTPAKGRVSMSASSSHGPPSNHQILPQGPAVQDTTLEVQNPSSSSKGTSPVAGVVYTAVGGGQGVGRGLGGGGGSKSFHRFGSSVGQQQLPLPLVNTSPNRMAPLGGSGGVDDDPRKRLQALQTCMSTDNLGLMDFATVQDEAGGGRGVGGSSPVATRLLVDRVLLNKCLSMHPDTLEFLSRQESIKRGLVNSGEEQPNSSATAAPAATTATTGAR